MKNYILALLLALTFCVSSFAEDIDNLTFAEFNKTLKREFIQDGSKFTFNLKTNPNATFTIVGDVNKGANVFVTGPNLLSKAELDKLLPTLKENAEIKNEPCSDFVDGKNLDTITACDVKFLINVGVADAYSAKYFKDVATMENLKGIARQSVFAMMIDDSLPMEASTNEVINEGIKIYEEFKGKNLLPDEYLLNFVYALWNLSEDKKDYFRGEYLKQLKEYKAKYSFNAFDYTLYQLLKTDDAEIKKELKEFVSKNLKNSSNIAMMSIWFLINKAFSTKANVGKDDFKLARELLGELAKSKNFAKENDTTLLLKRILIDLDFLSENPDYLDIKNRLLANKETPFEQIKLAYAFDKLGGEENLKKSQEYIAKFKSANKWIPQLYFLDVVFEKEYAKFIIKNFGFLNFLDFFGKTEKGKAFFDEIKNDKSFNFSKEDLMKVKMRNYISDIEACEVQEDPEDRKLAFKILKSYLENDKNCRNIGFLQYVLFCMCEGRNTEKNIEGAKKLLRNYLTNVNNLSPEYKKSALVEIAEMEESRSTFVKDRTIEIKVPTEIVDIVKNYDKENKTSNFCIKECERLLKENKYQEALNFYKEAIEKGFSETFTQIDILRRLAKILSNDELVKEVKKIEKGLKNDYYEILIDCRILEAFTYFKKYDALVKYLNETKSIKPFVKDEIFATLYKKGLGVEKNIEKSNQLFKKIEILDTKQLEVVIKFLYEHNTWQEIDKSRKDALNEILVQRNPDNVEAILNLAGTQIPSHKNPEKFVRIDKLYQVALHSPKYKGENLRYIYRFYALEDRPSSDWKKAFEVVDIVSKIKDSYNRVPAMERLATHYLEGLGVEKDEKKAIEILNEIVNDKKLNRDTYAYATLIYCMENGIGGLSKDEKKIDEYYKKIDTNDIFGITGAFRARHSIYKNRAPINREFATKFLNECVKRDIDKKQVLDLIYDYASENMDFHPTPYRDVKLAWQTLLEMEKLSPDDNAIRLHKAHHLLAGVGVEANVEEALKILEVARQKGSKINVALTYAYIYEKGIGVKPDKQKAEENKEKLKTPDFYRGGSTITENSIKYGRVLPYDKDWVENLKKELRKKK